MSAATQEQRRAAMALRGGDADARFTDKSGAGLDGPMASAAAQSPGSAASPGQDPVPSLVLQSFFLGGFECSSHQRSDGLRLDLLAATGHDRWAERDFRALQRAGIRTVRDGMRWHVIESARGRYNWSSFRPMLAAADRCGMQVIWDICHYGIPDHLDIWSGEFVSAFAAFSRATASLVLEETGAPGIYCPINEMSFWAWAGGDVAYMNPAALGRGSELKRQLVRANIAAIDAIRDVDPAARFITSEPLIHVVSASADRGATQAAEAFRLSQFEATDMLAGLLEPELGGGPAYLDCVGLNFYPYNQWYLGRSTIPLGHHEYVPLHAMLKEAFDRYRRPILISETGAEGSARPSWLHYVGLEVEEALNLGVPVEGICLYPILDYPGWENDRVCRVGLLADATSTGRRPVCGRTLAELRRQQVQFRRRQRMSASNLLIGSAR